MPVTRAFGLGSGRPSGQAVGVRSWLFFRAVLPEPFVGAGETLLERHRGAPAEAAQAADVHQLARRAVGLRRVPGDLALVADHALHELGQLADRQVFAAAHVEQAVGHARRRDVLEGEDDRLADVVDVEELAPRAPLPQRVTGRWGRRSRARPARAPPPRPPAGRAWPRGSGGSTPAARARTQVEVVVRAVEVGRHQREVVGAVLAVEAAAISMPAIFAMA